MSVNMLRLYRNLAQVLGDVSDFSQLDERYITLVEDRLPEIRVEVLADPGVLAVDLGVIGPEQRQLQEVKPGVFVYGGEVGRRLCFRFTSDPSEEQRERCGFLGDLYVAAADRIASIARHDESKQSFKNLAEGLPDTIVVHHQGQILYVNETFYRESGYSQADIETLSVMTLLVEGEREIILKRMAILEAGGVVQPMVQHFVRKDGSLIEADVTAVPVVFLGLSCSLVIVQNVEERNRAVDRLVKMHQMAALGTLSRGLAHEINNPLGVIFVNLDYVLEDVDSELNVFTQAALGDARDASQRISKVVNEFSALYQSEEARMPTRVEVLLNSVITLLKRRLYNICQVETHYKHISNLCIDTVEFTQLFTHLITNAIQGMEELPERFHSLVISTEERSGTLHICIKDTGNGLNPESLKRVYDPTFSTRAGPHGGLGLTLCKHIVKTHGGDLKIRSVRGQGTEVELTFPTR